MSLNTSEKASIETRENLIVIKKFQSSSSLKARSNHKNNAHNFLLQKSFNYKHQIIKKQSFQTIMNECIGNVKKYLNSHIIVNLSFKIFQFVSEL